MHLTNENVKQLCRELVGLNMSDAGAQMCPSYAFEGCHLPCTSCGPNSNLINESNMPGRNLVAQTRPGRSRVRHGSSYQEVRLHKCAQNVDQVRCGRMNTMELKSTSANYCG